MRIAPSLLCWAIALSAACTQQAGALSEDVGGPCEADEECADESVCEEGSLFPQGMCTLECETQSDCIPSTVCSEQGVCLIRCFADSDCRTNYSCIDVKRIGGGAEPVCANAPPL